MTEKFYITKYVAEGSYTRGHSHSLVNSDSDIPRLEYKRYVPLDNIGSVEGDLTIICGHANGIPKECYEPFFDDLLASSKKGGFRIRSIWIADYFNHGQSSILNADILGNDPCWTDHARDLLHFISTHRVEMPQPIVGIGHSLGASQLVHLALMHPRLMKCVVFMEPGWHPINPGFKVAAPTLNRQDTWPSRAAALDAFRKSKFHGIWDPRCLDQYVQFGLRDVPQSNNKSKKGESPVTLTTSKYQELATLMRPIDNVAKDTKPEDRFDRPECALLFQRLPEVRPPIFYLFGEQSGEWSGSKEEILKTTGTGLGGSGGMGTGQVKTDSIKKGTHFVPLEKPRECADKVSTYLGTAMENWRREEATLQKEWKSKSRAEQTGPDQRVVDAVEEAKRRRGKL